MCKLMLIAHKQKHNVFSYSTMHKDVSISPIPTGGSCIWAEQVHRIAASTSWITWLDIGRAKSIFEGHPSSDFTWVLNVSSYLSAFECFYLFAFVNRCSSLVLSWSVLMAEQVILDSHWELRAEQHHFNLLKGFALESPTPSDDAFQTVLKRK